MYCFELRSIENRYLLVNDWEIYSNNASKVQFSFMWMYAISKDHPNEFWQCWQMFTISLLFVSIPKLNIPSKCLIFSRWVTLSYIYWLTSQFIDLIINHHLFLTLIFHRYLFSSSSEAVKVEVTHKPLDPSDNSKEQPNQSTRCTTILVRKLVIGLIIVIGIAVSWVSLTQFIKETYSPTFNGPFFTIWFTTTWMMLCYPVHIAGTMVIFGDKRKGGVKKLYE